MKAFDVLKKIALVAVIAALLVSLCACGSKSDSSAGETTAQTAETPEQPEETVPETETAKATDTTMWHWHAEEMESAAFYPYFVNEASADGNTLTLHGVFEVTEVADTSIPHSDIGDSTVYEENTYTFTVNENTQYVFYHGDTGALDPIDLDRIVGSVNMHALSLHLIVQDGVVLVASLNS